MSVASRTLTVDWFFRSISWEIKPTEEITSVPSPVGTLSANRPFTSVEMPVVVPFSTTVAPGRPALVLSVTVPEMARVAVWATPMPGASPSAASATSRGPAAGRKQNKNE